MLPNMLLLKLDIESHLCWCSVIALDYLSLFIPVFQWLKFWFCVLSQLEQIKRNIYFCRQYHIRIMKEQRAIFQHAAMIIFKSIEYRVRVPYTLAVSIWIWSNFQSFRTGQRHLLVFISTNTGSTSVMKELLAWTIQWSRHHRQSILLSSANLMLDFVTWIFVKQFQPHYIL